MGESSPFNLMDIFNATSGKKFAGKGLFLRLMMFLPELCLLPLEKKKHRGSLFRDTRCFFVFQGLRRGQRSSMRTYSVERMAVR